MMALTVRVYTQLSDTVLAHSGMVQRLACVLMQASSHSKPVTVPVPKVDFNNAYVQQLT